MARKTATAKVEVRVQELKMRTIQLPIRGFDGPLVVNNWSAKAVREMLEKQITTKKRTKGPDPKDPEQDFRNSLYTYQQNGKTCYGFPATAFKKAMVRAVKLLKDTKQLDLDMVMAKQILFVIPDAQEDREVTVDLGDGKKFTQRIATDLVRINGTPKQRMDLVRLQGQKADVRFRGEFVTWTATLRIQYNPEVLDESTVVNLLYRAGIGVGIGEGRPEKGDQGWGRFEIVQSKKGKVA